jgi:hypothetical protein
MAWTLNPAVLTRRGDAFGIVTVLAITTIAAIQLMAGGTLAGQDSATQFYPWYGYLGQQLRSFEIPGWNPFQFAGTPFAADPQSGWTYLSAMVIFGLLPIPLAVPAFLWVHIALAGLGVYLLARLLRMPPGAAVVAGTAYQLTGPVYGRSVCCPAAMEIAVWTPWVFAGAELAIRAGSHRARLGGWVMAGFALSQALAAWLGQGSYYLVLALAAYIVFRTVLTPQGSPSLLSRGRTMTAHGIAIVAIGFGIAAAGLLPRLEYVERSNLAGGEYAGSNAWAATISGATSESVFERLLLPTLHYPGTATIALAIVGALIARGRFGAPYFGFLGIAACILASPQATPLHKVLYLVLPRFEELHQHWPERVSLVAYIAPSLLAGAAVAVLLEHPVRELQRWPAAIAPVGIVGLLWGFGAGVPPVAVLTAGAACALLMALIAAPPMMLRRAIPLMLVLLIAVDLLHASRATAMEAPYGGFHRIDMSDFYDSTGAAEFIQSRSDGSLARVFGYDPSLRAIQDGQTVLYRHEFANPDTRELSVNNRAMLLGLHDIQGYNPIQVQRYVEFMTALNGHPQDYHDANVFPAGLNSPLLDLLNVRYIVIPAETASWQTDVQTLTERFPVAYQDGQVLVLENPEALPRAWIVHDVRQVAPNETLDLLASGLVDPRTTALTEHTVPVATSRTDQSRDEVVITEHQPDLIKAQASTSSPGMLVFSEVYDPGWRAYVDGEPAPVHLVNHVMRGIPIPAGTHEIELRYTTPGLLIGFAITGATVAVLVAAFVLTGPGRGRRGGATGNRSPRTDMAQRLRSLASIPT